MILVTCPVSQSIHKQCQNYDFSRAIDISMLRPDILTGLVIQLENCILFLLALIIHSITCTIRHNDMSYHSYNLYITLTQLVHI